MRRKLLIGAITLATILLLAVVAAFLYVRSGRLDLFVQDEIIRTLDEMGIQASIEQTRLDLRGYIVVLEGIELHSMKTNRPIGRIERLEVAFSIISYLMQQLRIEKILITRPEVWIEVDEKARTNLDGLKTPPERETERGKVEILTATINVVDGILNLDDRRSRITARIEGFSVDFAPADPSSPPELLDHLLKADFQRGNATFEGRAIENITSTVSARIVEERAEDVQFNLTSSVGNARAAGRVTQFTPFGYDFTVNADLLMNGVARVFAPDTRMDGAVAFQGSVRGTGDQYGVVGNVSSESLTVEGFRISAFQADSDLRGTSAGYGATLEARTGAVAGPNISIGSIRLSEGTVRGVETDFDLAGSLVMASLRAGAVPVTGLQGRLMMDPERVTLSQFRAAMLGGAVTGTASISYTGGRSQVDARFNGIELGQAATLIAADDVTVTGTANGTANLSFPGFNYEASTGRITAAFDGTVAPSDPTVESTSVAGEMSLFAVGRRLRIDSARIWSDQSRVEVTGSVGWDARADLDVAFTSGDMFEVQRIVEGFGLAPEAVVQEYEVLLAGPGRFDGKVRGLLSNPEVVGHVSLDTIQAKRETVGSFTGDIRYSPGLLVIENGTIVGPEEARASFELTAPIGEEDGIALRGEVRRFPLPIIVAAAAPALSELVGAGMIDGTFDLKGLPGPRTIEGTARVSLSGGEFNLPSVDETQETTTVSVPEFIGSVTFADSLLRVEELSLTLGDSTIAGRGSFNLDTYAYSLDAEGTNFDLARISDALPDGVQLSGRARMKVEGEGLWDDWSDINITASIQGEDVAFNGRSLGDARLSIFTDNGQLKIEATGEILDQPQTLVATIDLRDRRNYPISAVIEFTDEDLGTYLALAAPELAVVSGVATGRIEISGPLQDPDNIRLTARLTRLEVGGAISDAQFFSIVNEDPIVLTASMNSVSMERVTFIGEGTRLTIEGTLLRGGGAGSNLTVEGDIDLRLVSSFTEAVYPTGTAVVEAAMTGPLERPRLIGLVTLRDVGLRVVDFPVSLNQGSGQIRFTQEQALIENFRASATGGGSVTIVGGAALSGLIPDRWRIEVLLDQVAAQYPRDTRTVVDASLVLQGNRRVQVLSGNVDIRRATYTRDITIEELITTGGPFGSDFLEAGPGGTGVGAGPAITLDLRIEANNSLVVTNNLVDAVASAFLTLRGPIADPIVSGRIQVTRGTIEFRQGRHELTRGIVTLPPRRGADPVIDFQSEAEISGYRVFVSFNGPLSRLQTSLRSDPELSEPDIVALVLTGSLAGDRRTETAAATQTGLGLAQSLLALGISEQLERGTQRLFGLSRFSIDPLIVGRGSDPTARVTLGQRITNDLTLTYSQNLTSSGPSGVDRIVIVEYRLTNRFSLVGFRNDRGDLGFDVRIRKRF